MTIYGYARVNTDGQTPESQLRALTRAIAERNTPPPQPQTPEAKIRATYGVNAMPEMSVAVFKAALRRHGFRVSGIRIVDMSGKCPGFSTTAVLDIKRGKIARNRTLAKCINERNAAVAKRALAGIMEEPE
jgi:hypothetical protein